MRLKQIVFGLAFLLDKAGEGGSGGGSGSGSGAGGDKGGSGGSGSGSGAGGGDELSALRAQNKALEERLAKLEAGGKKSDDDPDLQEKARKEREEKDRKASESKQIEAALKFSMGSKDWLKTNASLLPKDITGIFDAAEKENYGSAIEKDQAIKSALIQEFFKVQANLDLLTSNQKASLEDFLKLTKNGKQEKAQVVYDQIFEPTFEMLKRVKKAEQLGKEGHASSSDMETAYKDRMIKLSKKQYLGEKTDA